MQNMKARDEYALLAVLDLARRASEENPVPVDEVAERTGAARKYLVQILQDLKRKLIVRGVRGRSGGYYLIRPPRQISVAQVLEAVAPEETDEPDAEENASADSRAVRNVWLSAERQRTGELSRVSIADLLRRADASGQAEAE